MDLPIKLQNNEKPISMYGKIRWWWLWALLGGFRRFLYLTNKRIIGDYSDGRSGTYLFSLDLQKILKTDIFKSFFYGYSLRITPKDVDDIKCIGGIHIWNIHSDLTVPTGSYADAQKAKLEIEDAIKKSK